MGGCQCQKSTAYDPKRDAGDGPEIDISKITDPLTRFEKSFPFYRMHITTFLNKINSMGRDEFEIALLAKMFDTPAWEGCFDEGSELHELLEKLPET